MASTVRVPVIGPDGKLTGPVEAAKLVLTDEEWKQRLTPEQYRITRNKGTEPAFCGGLLHNKGAGVYVCVDCSLPLFNSATKFESGTGWPSFWAPIAKNHVKEVVDRTLGMERIEVECARCGGHLGHVFPDGPPPTGQRYCMNSVAMRHVPDGEPLGDAAPSGG